MHQLRSSLGRLSAMGAAAIAVIAVGALAACSDAESPGPTGIAASETGPTLAFARAGKTNVNKGFAALRRATARYHRVEVAIADGYVRDPVGDVCIEGIGIPFVNLDRLMDTELILTEPEVLFYEPRKNGKLRLVGSEPVVPIPVWDKENDDPPSMLGFEFHRNEEHGLYGLHFWTWRHNPNGRISFSNPRVSCEFIERTL